jgi:hypothetical protein
MKKFFMIDALQRHPFAVSAYFEFSLALSFALRKEILEPMLPPHLELDTFNEYGFLTVAMVQTKHLRPKGFPKFLGRNFFLIGYRLFVKYQAQNGKRLRGLYILKSETDKALMAWSGNLFTHYKYSSVAIEVEKSREKISVHSPSNLNVSVSLTNPNQALPVSSVFADWKDARRFAGPLPFTFDYEKSINSMIIIEGMRAHWEPRPVQVDKADIAFVDRMPFKDADPILSNAFYVEHIDYDWSRGRIEKQS